jgi:hypothetical protein
MTTKPAPMDRERVEEIRCRITTKHLYGPTNKDLCALCDTCLALLDRCKRIDAVSVEIPPETARHLSAEIYHNSWQNTPPLRDAIEKLIGWTP